VPLHHPRAVADREPADRSCECGAGQFEGAADRQRLVAVALEPLLDVEALVERGRAPRVLFRVHGGSDVNFSGHGVGRYSKRATLQVYGCTDRSATACMRLCRTRNALIMRFPLFELAN
jgi:hypothetical protein